MAFNLNKPHKLIMRGLGKASIAIQNGKVYNAHSGAELDLTPKDVSAGNIPEDIEEEVSKPVAAEQPPAEKAPDEPPAVEPQPEVPAEGPPPYIEQGGEDGSESQ